MDMLQDPQYKTPEGAALRIWRDSLQNNYLSGQEGRPVFDEVILCEVITPGSRDSTPCFELERVFHTLMNHPEPLRGPKYAEYSQYIEDFKRGENTDASLAGTPLTQWSEMTRSMVLTLRAADVYTVEALSMLPDTKLNIVGPDGRTWRAKAQAYLENAKNGAFATELAAKVERLTTDLDAAKQREGALAARVQELEAAALAAPAAPAPPRRRSTPAEVSPTETPDDMSGAPII